MTRGNPWQSYKKVATQTASPGQLVLMLFEGAIRFLDRSLTGFALDDPAERNATISNNLIRAQDILHELDASLNLEAGGELAQTLRALYQYCDRRLNESNRYKTDAGIHEVLRHLGELRGAWAAMLQGQITTPLPGVTPPARLAA
jgi:flagellar protein FliS